MVPLMSYLNDILIFLALRLKVKLHLLCFHCFTSRLNATKDAVKAAFADDFDTLGATNSIVNLIHHGNRQLQTVTKVTH